MGYSICPNRELRQVRVQLLLPLRHQRLGLPLVLIYLLAGDCLVIYRRPRQIRAHPRYSRSVARRKTHKRQQPVSFFTHQWFSTPHLVLSKALGSGLFGAVKPAEAKKDIPLAGMQLSFHDIFTDNINYSSATF